MSLNSEQEDEVRSRVVAQFGEDCVKKMDMFYMALNDIRITSKDSYEFLEKVKEKYQELGDTELLLAAILYGMKQGELGYQYHLKKEKESSVLPKYGHAM